MLLLDGREVRKTLAGDSKKFEGLGGGSVKVKGSDSWLLKESRE